MKNLLILILLCLGFLSKRAYSQSTALNVLIDSLQRGDTLYVNFGISPSEFGSSHEGILLYKKDGAIYAKYVLYNYGVSLLPNKSTRMHSNVRPVACEVDSVVSFYEKIKTNYFVMKSDWKLDDKQIGYLKNYFQELEKFIKPEGFSNAPDFYTVISGETSFVVIDKVGKWDKFLEVKKNLRLCDCI